MIPKSQKPTVSNPEELPEFAKLAVGGVSGSGKTHLFGTVGKGNKILVLDTEGGSVTYSSKFFRNDENATERQNIDVVKLYDGIDSANKLVHEVESVLDYLIRTKNSDGYKLVVLDSMTEMQQLFLDLHTAADPRQSYGAWKDSLHTLVAKARKVPAHVAFSATLKSTQDDVLGREIVRFDLAPSAWSTVQRLFDVIGYLTVKAQGRSVIRTLDTDMGLRTQGKDRYGLSNLQNPSMVDILNVVSKEAQSRKGGNK